MQFQITPKQLARAEKEWSDLAGEPLKVEMIADVFYAWGSELACRRLSDIMKKHDSVGQSANRNGAWYFCMMIENFHNNGQVEAE
jgi:hypothetical protein